MKVVTASDVSHAIAIIPRIYDLVDLGITLINEATKEETEIATFSIDSSGAIWSITFDFTFSEGDKYIINIETLSDVLFRGRILATDQDVETYDVTDGYYEYG